MPFFGAMAFAALYIIKGDLMSYHVAYIGVSSEDIKADNPELMFLISIFIRLIGSLLLCAATCLAYASHGGVVKQQKWGLHIYIIAGAFTLIPLIPITFAIGGLGLPFPFTVIFLVFWIIGVFISVKFVNNGEGV